MPVIRGLDQLLADLDSRARRAQVPRNRVITKLLSVFDNVTLSDAAPTITLTTVPFLWATSTGLPPQGSDLAWGLGEWT